MSPIQTQLLDYTMVSNAPKAKDFGAVIRTNDLGQAISNHQADLESALKRIFPTNAKKANLKKPEG